MFIQFLTSARLIPINVTSPVFSLKTNGAGFGGSSATALSSGKIIVDYRKLFLTFND